MLKLNKNVVKDLFPKIEKKRFELISEMKPSGEYIRIKEGKSSISAHNYFMSNPSLSGRGKSIKIKKPKDLVFKK